MVVPPLFGGVAGRTNPFSIGSIDEDGFGNITDKYPTNGERIFCSVPEPGLQVNESPLYRDK